MGRYTTVQTYTDNDQRGTAPKITYEQATGGRQADVDKPAEGFRFQKVENVSGSTAGAGSGEFHVYRAQRRREYARLEAIEKNHKKRTEEEEFQERLRQNKLEVEERTKKRAEKRRRRKQHAKVAKEAKKMKTGGVNGERNVEKEEKLLETPGGAPLIPNDGTFMEKMLRAKSASCKD